jgi:hypothetical protein
LSSIFATKLKGQIQLGRAFGPRVVKQVHVSFAHCFLKEHIEWHLLLGRKSEKIHAWLRQTRAKPKVVRVHYAQFTTKQKQITAQTIGRFLPQIGQKQFGEPRFE